jgi:hypothetical protein
MGKGSAAMEVIEDGLKEFGGKLNSNKEINNVYDFFSKGFRDVASNLKREGAEGGLTNAIKDAYYDKEAKSLKYGSIAGSYLGISAGYRLASGGGLYKDKNGNTNIIGVPFI